MIGVGIITCDRPEFFKKCYDSIPKDAIDQLVIVNDGEQDVNHIVPDEEKHQSYYIRHTKPYHGVGLSKHQAIEHLLNRECEHIFLIEDDIVVTNPNVFDKYISASKETGIKHFMFGYHGPANKNGISKGTPAPKWKFKYNKNIIVLNQHCVGAFCYYHKDCFDVVGNFDLGFNNAFEHIDHSYRIAKEGLTTPYWNWADIYRSWEFLDELACSEENSSIRPRSDWQKNIQLGYDLFKQKHNYTPFGQGCVPDVSFNDIKKILKDIHEKHSDRD